MAAVKVHSTVIAGKRYETTTFNATEGLKLLPRVMAVLPPDIAAKMFTANDEEFASLLLDEDFCLNAALVVLAYADDLSVVPDLLVYTVCTNELVGDVETEAPLTARFSEHFRNNYVQLFRVASWVARVSFRSP